MPAYHPAPFDTRYQEGSTPVYEKVVYKLNERNVKNTFEKLRRSYEIENLAASMTGEPTISQKSTRRRRWEQPDPRMDAINSLVLNESEQPMFPPIMIRSTDDSLLASDDGPNPNREFLEGIIAPPIIPVTRRRSTCEIDGIFNNDTSMASHEITQVKPIKLGRTGSGMMSNVLGEAPTISSSSSNGGAFSEGADHTSSSQQANINRIRAFIEVN